MLIAGVDLAWSGRRPTGICLLEATASGLHLLELRCTDSTHTATEIGGWLSSLGPNVVAGIDAPLVVTDARRAEAELARAFGRQGVYAYSARTEFLARHGIAEGPRLGELLANEAWNLDPGGVTAETAGRHALELFPHAIIVSLFGAPAALKYKKGRQDLRLGPLEEFRRLLQLHCREVFPALLSHPMLGETFLPLAGRELKALEDQLDALACALGAYHIWKFGPPATLVFGDTQNGYIAVPRRVTSFPAPSSPSGRALVPARSARQAPIATAPATSLRPP